MWKNILFDVESDGLLDTITRVWIFCATDLDTGEEKEFLEGDLGWQALIDNCKKLVGHNIVGYDIEAIFKIHGYTIPDHVVVVDTLILSQVLNYRRFGNDGHSLERWGQALGVPKQEHEDWSQFSPEMAERCRSDVRLNILVYKTLRGELQKLMPRAPKLESYLDAEHALAQWCAVAERVGWPFDRAKGESVKEKLTASMGLAYVALAARLGTKTVAVDKVKGVVEEKRPRWLKNGFYDQHTCNWFNIEPPSGFEGEERMVLGPYSRVEFVPLSLDSVADVKIFLFRNGWVPLEFNYKKDDSGKRIQTSPKITEESLEFLGGDGKLYADFAVSKSRLGILNTWLKSLDKEDRLHGSCMVIGTPSLRATHSIIVNVPSTESVWGREMRELFTVRPGYKLVGCDSAGNQARGLAHYLGDPVFTDTLLHGDIHTFNANALDKVLEEMGIDWTAYLIKIGIKADEKHTQAENIAKRKRACAKRILYAFLFGASGGKLWSYIFSVPDESQGKKLKLGFTKAVPGFTALLKKLSGTFTKTRDASIVGDGYLPSPAGVRVYVDSFHKLLVYLLQATEKATCACAVMLLMRYLKEAKIPYEPRIFMHDEIQFEVPEEFAEKAGELGKLAFKEGPKLMGVTIMDGDFKVGNNWFDTH